MSGSTNEDEWDAAEVRLKELTVIQKEKKPSVKLLLKPPMSLASNTSVTTNVSSSEAVGSPKLSSTADLDSVLLDAISDPRERMVVFQIENNILNFMNSNENTMEIPPGYNSFRRLLSYRVGQRFGLNHTSSDQLNENGERAVVLYKTSSSAVPTTLLIDMSTGTPTGGATPEPGSDAARQGASAAATGAPQRKMQVMKRKPAKEEVQSARSSSGAGKQQQSTEDKEKAYLEARARIFGETGTPNSEGSCPSPVGDSAQQSSGNSTPKSDAASQQGVDASTGSRAGQIPKCPSSGSLAGGIASQNASQRRQSDPPLLKQQSQQQSPIEKSASSGSLNAAEGGNNKRAPVNAGNWKENKSQLRNQDAERSDPDFVRRGNPSGSRHNHNSSAGGRNYQQGGGGGGFAQKQGQQLQLPQQQQQQAPQQGQQYAMYTDPAVAAQMQAQQMQMQMQIQMQMQMQAQQMHNMYQGYPPAGGMPGAPYQPALAYPMGPGPGPPPGQYFMAPPMPPGVPYGAYPQYAGQQQLQQPPQQQQQRAGSKGQVGGGLNNNDFPPLS